MKISVNDQELYTLSDTQKKVIQDNVPADIFEDDMKRRLQWVLMHKYEQSFKDLKDKWDSLLKENGVKSVPTDPDEYAQLVFSQPNYLDRKSRDASLKDKYGK